MTNANARCSFCQIPAGQLPANLLLSEPEVCVFLDSRPLFKGHALVIPRTHVETLTDLPAPRVEALFSTVQRIAQAIETGLSADGSFVAINNRISQSVPHLHVHVVPRHQKDGLRGFFWPRQRYQSDEERADFAARIARAL